MNSRLSCLWSHWFLLSQNTTPLLYHRTNSQLAVTYLEHKCHVEIAKEWELRDNKTVEDYPIISKLQSAFVHWMSCLAHKSSITARFGISTMKSVSTVISLIADRQSWICPRLIAFPKRDEGVWRWNMGVKWWQKVFHTCHRIVRGHWCLLVCIIISILYFTCYHESQ